MNFYISINKRIEIKNRDKAKEIITKFINLFEIEEKDEGEWAQLILVFDDHYDIYKINDSFDDIFIAENSSILDDLMRSINSKEIISSIFVHYKNENDADEIKCTVSSIYLDTYVEGTKNTITEEFEFAEPDFTNGIKGEPMEVTSYLEYNKGCLLSPKLIQNFTFYIGATKENILHKNEEIHLWDRCEKFEFEPNQIKRIFGVDVKNNYFIYILKSGEIMVTTPISTKYTLDNEDFMNYCGDNGNNEEFVQEFFLKRIYVNDEPLMFGCLQNYSIIKSLIVLVRFEKQDDNLEQNNEMMCNLAKYTISNYISILESYCNKVAGKYKR